MCGGDLEVHAGMTIAKCPYCGTSQTLPQWGIFEVSQKEAPYDVFICYKEVDSQGERTLDSVLANELYDMLTQEGFKVFFSRITLEDKLGMAYEPYIFAALNSAKVMVVVGTKPEHFHAVGVKNEWSCYLSLIKKDNRKVLIPVYKNMSPYDLPIEFSHLQAQDMAKLGFMQDLLRGIRKIVYNDAYAAVREFVQPPPEPERMGAGRHFWGGALAALVIIMFCSLWVWQRKISKGQEEPQTAIMADYGEQLSIKNKMVVDNTKGLDGVLAQFAAEVFQMPAEKISREQLAQIQWLVIDYSTVVSAEMLEEQAGWKIGYSFEDPWETAEEQLNWLCFPSKERNDLYLDCLPLFTGIKKLSVDSRICQKYIEGLPLESISGYFESPAKVLEIVEDPLAIREICFYTDLEELQGIEQFQNLESLCIEQTETKNMDRLASLGKLKKLTVKALEETTDFSALGKLTGLEELWLDAKSIKTVDFLANLGNLKTLKISRGEMLSLDGLDTCSRLKKLEITGCNSLKDMSAVAQLAGLEELRIAVPYDCPTPDLGKLSKLKKLSLSTSGSCSFLQELTGLTELELGGCSGINELDLSGLTSLKALSCSSSDMEVDFIKDFSALEKLDMHGCSTYEDISGLFQMPKLKELNISGMECEINFDKIKENSILETLHMEDLLLYKNVVVQYDGIITYVDWDNVELDGHLDFLKKFPVLRELYLGENKLTDISFAEGLSALEVLDISENYITELKPLAGLQSLKKVVCTGNPIVQDKVLRDSVELIQD